MQHDFILLDRSGSMHTIWTETINSVNSYVKGLADQNIDTGVTLAAFDKNDGHVDFTILRDRITPKTWHDVKWDEASPRGFTPLNDAVGKIVALAEAGKYDKVAIIIVTDGHENASVELNVQQAKDLLEKCKQRGWAITFLGANYDNIQQAASYGFGQHTTVNASVGNMRSTMAAMAGKRGLYSNTGDAATMSWTKEEQAEAKKPSTPR